MSSLLRLVIVSLAGLWACDHAPAPAPILEATTSRAVAEGDDPTVVAPDALTTPALGARDPLVVVTLFTDYQCENCRRMHDVAARLLDRWPDEVQLQFRQLPLQMHPLARPAALAALAAHRQGRFQCMNSALTRSRLDWTGLSTEAFFAFVRRELLPRCAMGSERFDTDIADSALAAKVQDDWELAGELGVRGTPTVLVDGLDARLWPRAGVKPALLLNALVRRSLREAHAQRATCEPRCDGSALIADRIYGNLGDVDKTSRLLGTD